MQRARLIPVAAILTAGDRRLWKRQFQQHPLRVGAARERLGAAALRTRSAEHRAELGERGSGHDQARQARHDPCVRAKEDDGLPVREGSRRALELHRSVRDGVAAGNRSPWGDSVQGSVCTTTSATWGSVSRIRSSSSLAIW